MSRRIKSVQIGTRYIEMLPYIDFIMLKDGTPMKIKGIPKDVELVDWEIRRDTQSLTLYLEHESFPETPEGCIPQPSTYIHDTKNWVEVTVE